MNAALQRARATLRRHRPKRDEAGSRRGVGERELQLVKEYADATERLDVEALAQLLRDDARFTMPPQPMAFVGRRTVVDSWVSGGFGAPPYDHFRCVLTSANGQPAVANYIRNPGDTHYRPFALDVLRIENGQIAEIVAFDIAGLVDAFGIPETLS